MDIFKEYSNYDGLGLAQLVKKKEVSSEELCEVAIQKIEATNPKINAVVTSMYSQARQSIKDGLPEGLFTGVPFLLKDLIASYAGVRMTKGSKACKNYISKKDSELVKRYKRAGLVILGKTNCPEFGLMGYTEPQLHGATRNPWNTNHTPGGSSGGSAAAVSSTMVPIASGGDGGGSIRIPASCCGLFGMKPTRGRIPTGPDYGEIWQGAVSEHILSRSVRDSAAMLDATQGADIGAPYVIPEPEIPYLREMEKDTGSLIIAFNTVSPIGTDVNPEYIKAVEKTAKMLEKMGHKVEEARPDIDGQALANSYMNLYFGEIAADLIELESVLGRKTKARDVEISTWVMGMLGRTFTSGDFVKGMREWGIASRVMGHFHEKYDVYMTPTIAHPPAKIGELKPRAVEVALMKIISALRLGKLIKASGMVNQMAIDSLAKTPFTQLANFTGQPAMSVPLHSTSDGLPCGIQFIGRFADEATLFRLAGQLEKESPWFDKRPVGMC